MASWDIRRLRRSGIQFVGLLAAMAAAVALSACLGDDSYLNRGKSGIASPISAGAGGARTGLVSSRDHAADVRDGKLFVAIGDVVLKNHAGDDFFSSPDIYVQVQRRDPVILSEIEREKNELSDLSSRQRSVAEELKALRAKREESEIKPGKPLSPTRSKRLTELSAEMMGVCDKLTEKGRCRQCERHDERTFCGQCEACDELRFLLDLKAKSEIVPGPPLTGAEKRRLAELTEQEKRISKEVRGARSRLKALRDSITGKTETITTPGYTLDYGFKPVQEVFAGDKVWIAVYDEDLDADDLYGSTAFTVGKDVRAGEQLNLSMPNVRSVIVRIISP